MACNGELCDDWDRGRRVFWVAKVVAGRREIEKLSGDMEVGQD